MDWMVESQMNQGMSRNVAEGIALLKRLWPNGDGPAHVVHADYNLEDIYLMSCIDGCSHGNPLSDDYDSINYPVYPATAAVLQWLLDNTTEQERIEWL